MGGTAEGMLTRAASVFRAPIRGHVQQFRLTSSLPVDKYTNWIFDCDGVLWSGNRPIPGSLETIEKLTAAGKNCVFVTNNATKTRTTYSEKFARLGLEGVDISRINTAGSAAAH